MKEKHYIKSFEQLFQDYFKKLNIYAISYVHDSEIARDITHEAYITLWNKRNHLDYTQPFYPLLACIVRNKCLNHLKHRHVAEQYIEKIKYDDIEYNLFDDANDDDLVDKIIVELDNLPERCRIVMQKCFLENKKYKEVAEELGISHHTVKEHVSNGLKILRKTCVTLLICYFSFKK